VSGEEQAFRDYLREHGLRFTPERRAILKAVYRTHDHFRAEDLEGRVRAGSKRVSRATIYRTLKHLAACGLLREVALGGKQTWFEHTLGHKHHDHLVCVSCGRVVEFLDDTLEQVQQRLCREHGFVPMSHRMRIMGLCRRCARVENRQT
jgi:Fur family ferric uptake transcriptional regulator